MPPLHTEVEKARYNRGTSPSSAPTIPAKRCTGDVLVPALTPSAFRMSKYDLHVLAEAVLPTDERRVLHFSRRSVASPWSIEHVVRLNFFSADILIHHLMWRRNRMEGTGLRGSKTCKYPKYLFSETSCIWYNSREAALFPYSLSSLCVAQ